MAPLLVFLSFLPGAPRFYLPLPFLTPATQTTFCGMLFELMNFAHRLLQQLKTPYITGITAIELNSHWYVILPSCRLKANETSRNNFCQVMADNRVPVVVSNKFLEIDEVSSEFEFLNNYLLLYILIRFIISVFLFVCFYLWIIVSTPDCSACTSGLVSL